MLRGFYTETQKRRNQLEFLGLNGRVMLRRLLKEEHVRLWTGLICFKWTSWDSCGMSHYASSSGTVEIRVEWVYLPQVHQRRPLWTGSNCPLKWDSGYSCGIGLSVSSAPAETPVDWVNLSSQAGHWRFLWTVFICLLKRHSGDSCEMGYSASSEPAETPVDWVFTLPQADQWRFLWTGFICLKLTRGDTCGLGLPPS
jgi:hypothetical protein